MQQPKDLAKIIRSNYDLAGAPFLALILLGLEKLMETEFTCPDTKSHQILYSLIFIFCTMAILCVFVCSCGCCNRCCIQCCNSCETRQADSNIKQGQADSNMKQGQADSDIEQGPCTYEDCKNCECCGRKCCSCCSENCYKFIMSCRAPILWILILITDGRYFSCLFKSKVIMTTEEKLSCQQISQMVGLCLILVFVSILCICKHYSCRKTPKTEEPKAIEFSEVGKHEKPRESPTPHDDKKPE